MTNVVNASVYIIIGQANFNVDYIINNTVLPSTPWEAADGVIVCSDMSAIIMWYWSKETKSDIGRIQKDSNMKS